MLHLSALVSGKALTSLPAFAMVLSITMSKIMSPSIVLVPGVHHVPEHFQPVTTLLEKDGYRVIGVKLPSPIDDSLPPGFEGDVLTIRKAIEGEIQLRNNILLVVHSAGGVTGPAAMKGLAKNKDSDEPGVICILAISAILAPPGQVAGGLLEGRCCLWRTLEVRSVCGLVVTCLIVIE